MHKYLNLNSERVRMMLKCPLEPKFQWVGSSSIRIWPKKSRRYQLFSSCLNTVCSWKIFKIPWRSEVFLPIVFSLQIQMGHCQTNQKILQIIMEMPVKQVTFYYFSKCGFDKSKKFPHAYLIHYTHKITELIIAYETVLSK